MIFYCWGHRVIKEKSLLVCLIIFLMVPFTTSAEDEYIAGTISTNNLIRMTQSYSPAPETSAHYIYQKPDTNFLISKEQNTNYLDMISPRISLPPVVSNTMQIGSALVASFAIHELGHKVLGDYVGASGTDYNLFSKKDGKFFLGVSSIENIDDESMVAYSLAGEVAADLTFEQSLRDYRKSPSAYNTSMMILSGTDFVRYCIYAFYLSEGHYHYDPVSLSNESGISRDTIFAVALTKTLINAYRVYSGNDFVIPYFAVNKNTAMINFRFSF